MSTISFLDETKNLPEGVKDYLEQAEMTKAECFLQDRSLYLYFEAANYPSQSTYNALKNVLYQKYPSDTVLTVIPSVREDSKKHSSFEECFFMVLSDISLTYRQSADYLRWVMEENIIKLYCHQKIVFDRLQNKGFLDLVAKLVFSMSGREIQVIFELDEDIDEQEREKHQKLIMPQTFQGKALSELTEGVKKTATSSRSDLVLAGKIIRGEETPIHMITEEENNMICAGYIFESQVRELKSGRNLFIFSLTDNQDSISCKYFAEAEDIELLSGALDVGNVVKVRGKLRVDTYTQELTLNVYDINRMELSCRTDNANEKRVELHLHTKMSPMDGVSSLKSLMTLASDFGHEAIALTDHGVVQSFPEAYFLGKKLGIKVIYGIEAYIFDDSISDKEKPRSYHCIVLAKNKTGLKNLYKLVTESHLRYFKRRPRIPKRLLDYARGGLVIGSACEAGELIQHLIHKPEDWDGLKELASFYDYIEIQPLANNAFMVKKGLFESMEGVRELNVSLDRLARELNKPLVATCDVHFANAEDAIYRGIIMAGNGFKDAEEQAPLYYRSTEEMLDEFAYLGKERAYEAVVTNPRKIISDFEELKPVPDGLHAPYIEGAEDEIMQLTMEKAKRLYGDNLPEIVEKRIKKELDSILGNGFAVLYLIAHKLVKKSNEDGYVVGSRGSVGSSVVAFFTDITEVNALPPHYRCPKCQHSEFFTSEKFGAGVDMPDKLCPICQTLYEKDGFDIPFEIFLGFKGDKVPDIDLNFSGDYQPHAHHYTEELFGVDRVFRAGTIATVAEKTAYGYVNKYFESVGETRRPAEINRLRNGCSGVKRTTGQHPGGLMVIPQTEDIHGFTPLQRPADDVKTETVTTHFDYHSISERLVKLDILGHDDPTVIKMLEDLTQVDIRKVPLDDEETLSLFSSIDALQSTEERLRTKVGTYGIPEFNTRFVRQMLEDTKPKSFSDLLRISGYSHGTDVWLNNARDMIKDGIDVSETISTRDDIMLYLTQRGVESVDAFSIMERVRKGKGLTEENLEIMHKANIAPYYIESCEKIRYLFPKAHAVAYVMMAFRIAWFKLNYPLAFYASYFTVRGAEDFDAKVIVEGEDSVRKRIESIYEKGKLATTKENRQVSVLEVALEMYVRGYTFLPIDYELSEAERFLIEGNSLRPPFICIEGLGRTVAGPLVEARKKTPFISIEDMKKRGHIGDAMIEEMQKMNVLKELPATDQILLF